MTASVIVTGVASTLLVVGPISEASATHGKEKTYTRSYKKTLDFYSKPLKRCVRTTLTGKVTFKHSILHKGKGGMPHRYRGVKVSDPKMETRVLTKCKGGKAATLTKAKLTQRWYESKKCKMDVAVTAGFPWSVAVTPTVECGKREAGTRSTTYSTKSKVYTQHNSGQPLYFTGQILLGMNSSKSLCLSGRPTVTAYIKNKSDSWAKTAKVCFEAPRK
ncbi:hypothetical protein GL263_06735 [Streptomyces durbertensis]|uniref:Uncharacterized protein n=1 Tax=Streptomyces durbertensis TaxID=2448886 RepID=A0ABR6ED52_9ACTN|nr:hypothetical protein [Streptomyces durbertensis]MBB1243260.1 hypothetical protein [Streptomyces durbertensis]